MQVHQANPSLLCYDIGMDGGLHHALWNNLWRLQTRDVSIWTHTTLLEKGEANEQSYVTRHDQHLEICHLESRPGHL